MAQDIFCYLQMLLIYSYASPNDLVYSFRQWIEIVTWRLQ